MCSSVCVWLCFYMAFVFQSLGGRRHGVALCECIHEHAVDLGRGACGECVPVS